MCSKGYSTWCVCLIVVSYSRTTGYNSFRIMQTFPETTACEKYAVKTSEKADIRGTGLLDLFCLLCVLWRQKEVTKKGIN